MNITDLVNVAFEAKNVDPTLPKWLVVRKDNFGMYSYLCKIRYTGNDYEVYVEGKTETIKELAEELNK